MRSFGVRRSVSVASDMRRLKDYPLGEWMEAADGCEFCGAKHMIKVTWVDETGGFGEVLIRTDHKGDCLEFPLHIDERGDIAGWEWSDHKITIAGSEWTALKTRANIGPCLSCGKLVVGVPLILWPGDGEVELDFCFKCAEEIGILDLMKPSEETGQMVIK